MAGHDITEVFSDVSEGFETVDCQSCENRNGQPEGQEDLCRQ